MIAAGAERSRHPPEAELLTRGATGDVEAAEHILGRLASIYPWQQQAMVEAIRRRADLRLWQRLLTCLAFHRWEAGAQPPREDRETWRRIDAALVRLFVEDDNAPEVTAVKLAVLRQALTDPDYRVRGAAAGLLGLRGEARALGALIEAVRRGEPECKLRAVAALGKLKDERGGWALIEALASDDDELHEAASQALDALGDKAAPALREALRSPKPHVRWHAVRALGAIGEVAAATDLTEALDDDDYAVRWAAAEALAALGRQAVPSILERLSRQPLSEELPQAAYHALNQMGPPEIHKRLQPLLAALHGPTASTEAPGQAFRLLQAWENEE